MISMGTVMEIDKSKALVFTMDGSAVYVKPRLGLFVGQQIAFSKNEVVTARKRLLSALPYAAMAAALLVVACITTGMFGMSGLFTPPAGQCAAYIALDINPSVQFRIDEQDKVLAASALNDDGKTLLKNLNPVGKLIKQAVDEAIAKAKELGYIESNQNVVLIAGALNDSNSTVTGRRSEYRSKLESLLGSMGSNGEADVLALYIDDSSMVQDADKHKLSLGRELLRQFAATNNTGFSDEQIRNGRIGDLIDGISGPQSELPIVKCAPDPTVTPTASPTPEPTATPSPEPTAQPTAEPTDKPTPKPTQAPTPKPTDAPAYAVSAKAYGTGIKVTWAKAPDTGKAFQYYKVVFSVNDSTPRYPDNGYVKVVSDIGTLSAVIKPGASSNGGDFSQVKAGATYYVSVTVVYEGDAVYGNAVRVKCPEAPEPTDPPSGFNGAVSASVSGDHIAISWEKAPTADGFQYYKVVLSKSDSSPRYPDNGYLHAISNIDDTSCAASPGDCYNGGDGGCLEAGATYYISVTYVYDDRKLYGTVKHVTMPGTAPEPTADPRDGFVGNVSAGQSGDHISISWDKAPTANGFQYYKVVLSKSDSTPKYNENGYLHALGFNTTSCSASPGQCYNGGDCGTLQAGETYYISVTYVYGDKKIYGTVQRVMMPGTSPTPEPTCTPCEPTCTPCEEPTPTPTV